MPSPLAATDSAPARTWPRLLLPGALVLVALSRLLWIGLPTLLSDEAYYWAWSRRLDLGYFDHPPMVALVIHASTALAGANEFGVRAGMALLGVATVALVYLAGALLGGRLAGWLCLAALATCPLFVLLTSVAAPDGPMIFFWAATLYALLLAVTRDSRYWYAAGPLMGLALLSKYTALLLVPSVLLFMLLSGGAWLRRREPYLASGLALLVYSPNLWWNLRHDWVSLSFQLAHGACQVGHTDPSTLAAAALYGLAQGGIVGPLLALLMVAGTLVALRDGLRHGQQGPLLLACCTLVVGLFFFLTHGLSYWTAPAYLSGVVCAGLWLADLLRRATPGRRTVLAAFGAVMVLSGAVESTYGVALAIGAVTPPRLAAGIDPILVQPEFDWSAVGRDVARVLRHLEPWQRRHVVLVGDNFSTSAAVAFYTPGRPPVYSGSHQFRLWPAPVMGQGGVVLYIGNHSWLGPDERAPLRRGERVPVWVWVGQGSARRGLQITVLPLPSGRAGAAKMQGILASTYFRGWHCR